MRKLQALQAGLVADDFREAAYILPRPRPQLGMAYALL